MSELGDKTFFIAAILAMRNNKLTVFLAAIAALGVMTVLSARASPLSALKYYIHIVNI